MTEILPQIAKRLVQKRDIESVGVGLGFVVPEIERYIQNNTRFNQVTYEGTLLMLRDWLSKVPLAEDGQELLKDALDRAGMKG